MAGKKRLNKKKDGRGGARPGAGRPRKDKDTISIEILKDVFNGDLIDGEDAIEEIAQKHDYTIDQFLLGIVYADRDVLPGSESIPLVLRKDVAIQLKNFMKVSKQEINISDNRQAPFNLPPLKEDPALKLVKGGKKVEDDQLIPGDGGDNCE